MCKATLCQSSKSGSQSEHSTSVVDWQQIISGLKDGFYLHCAHCACTASIRYHFFPAKMAAITALWGCVFNFAWRLLLLQRKWWTSRRSGCNVAPIKPLLLIPPVVWKTTMPATRLNSSLERRAAPPVAKLDCASPALSRLIRVWPSVTEKRSEMRRW